MRKSFRTIVTLSTVATLVVSTGLVSLAAPANNRNKNQNQSNSQTSGERPEMNGEMPEMKEKPDKNKNDKTLYYQGFGKSASG